MQILRCSRDYARSWASAYHVGERYDIEGRNGRRPTNAALSLRRVSASCRSVDLAGEFGGIMGNGWRGPRPRHTGRRFFEGCDGWDACGIPEKERRSVQ